MAASIIQPTRSTTKRHGRDSVSACLPASASASDPEVALMLRVQADEPGAFAELVDRYWGRVFGHFCRQLGDRQEAEDLTQEVFLRVYRHRKRYQPRAKFATWLYHIVQNLIRNALRFRRRHPHLRPASLDGAESNQPAARPLTARAETPTCPLERREVVSRVRAAVAELGERQRVAMELHQFQHRTYVEIAAEMDMTPKAAKSLLYRARNQLRDALTPFMQAEA
jgi:RNA polymerase sigma-70 factor (ECF subfamily)